jgi:hypothetical protein
MARAYADGAADLGRMAVHDQARPQSQATDPLGVTPSDHLLRPLC